MNYTEISNERLGETYYQVKHPSGLTIVVCPKKDYNSAYALIGTQFGSINSRFICNGKTVTVPDGTAHYLEHKLFESEEGDAFHLYAKTGASANAFTSFNNTCYLFSCTDQFKESLEILFDLIQSPYFTPETVAKEQGIIGQEIKMYADNPDWKVFINLLQALYQNHPMNKDIAGSVESIAEITPEVLYECYNGFYNLHNMVLCVAGKVSLDEVLAVADSKLKNNEPVSTESVFPDEPYAVAKPLIEEKLPVAVPQFALGFKENAPLEYPTLKEYLCTNILLDAFGGTGSALYRRLLDENLINSGFSSSYLSGPGYRTVVFEGESREPRRAAELIQEAVVRLHETGISQEDFDIALRSVYGNFATSFESPASIAYEFVNAHFSRHGVFEAADILAAVTLDDINERLSHQLDPQNCALSLITGIE